jgi:hypothetical protein
MAKKTLHDRIVAALLQRGEAITEDIDTRRYTVMTRTNRDAGTRDGFFFVGRSGALRTGYTVTKSRPVSEVWRTRLLYDATNV